jgi:hypothetical protein
MNLELSKENQQFNAEAKDLGKKLKKYADHIKPEISSSSKEVFYILLQFENLLSLQFDYKNLYRL